MVRIARSRDPVSDKSLSCRQGDLHFRGDGPELLRREYRRGCARVPTTFESTAPGLCPGTIAGDGYKQRSHV